MFCHHWFRLQGSCALILLTLIVAEFAYTLRVVIEKHEIFNGALDRLLARVRTTMAGPE